MLDRLKRQNFEKLVIMLWNVVRMILLKCMKGKKVHVSFIQNIHPSTELAINGGYLELAHSVFTRSNVSFRVEGGALKIGTSFFNRGCCITAIKHIEIGDECLFGPNVVIVDHDHDFRYLDNQRGNHYKCADVHIGNNVWVGANVTILRGSEIGDNCVIGAGCVIKGKVKNNTVVYAKENHVKKIINNL